MNAITSLSITRGFQLFQVFRFAALLVTGILLSKSDISVRTIGTYEGLIFISGAVSFFWVNGILNGLLVQYKKEENFQKSYFFNTGILLVVLSCILILLLLIFKNFVANFLPNHSQEIFMLMLIYIFLNNPTFLIEHIFLLKEKTIHLLVYGMVSFVAYVSAVVIPIWLGYGIEFSFYGLIFLVFLKNIFLGRLMFRENDFRFDKNVVLNLLSYASPLILSFAIAGSAEYIDGLLVSSHFGSDEFAIFRYGAREFPLAVLLSSSLSSSFIPRFSGLISSQELENLKRESGKLMNLLFPLTILLILFSNVFYPWIFRQEFVSSAPIFNTYLLLLISRVLFPQTLVLAAGKTNVILGIAFVELVVNFSCSYFLMMQYGLIGIAIGTVIAFYTEKLLLILYVKKSMNIEWTQYLSVNRWVAYTILLFSVYFLTIFC